MMSVVLYGLTVLTVWRKIRDDGTREGGFDQDKERPFHVRADPMRTCQFKVVLVGVMHLQVSDPAAHWRASVSRVENTYGIL